LTKGGTAVAYGWFIIFARWRQCAPPSNTWFLGPTRVHNPTASWSVQLFL